MKKLTFLLLEKHTGFSIITQLPKAFFLGQNQKVGSGNNTYPHNTRPPIDSKSVWQYK